MNSSSSLLLEIQSGLVQGAIVEDVPGHDGKRSIMHSASTAMTGAPYRDSAHMLSAMSKALSQTLSSLPNIHAVSKIDCILSSPWIISRTKDINVRYGEERVVTKRLVSASVTAERKKMEADFGGEGAHGGTAGDGMVSVEQKIFEIRINGYPVQDVEGLKAREIGIFFGVSMSPKTILDRIGDGIEKAVGRNAKHVTYHASTLMRYVLFRNETGRDSYILGHVHGELSDIVVVKKGLTDLTASFPFGYSSLTRHVSKALGHGESSGHSKIRLHAARHLHGEEDARISAIIDPIIREQWADQFLKALERQGSPSDATAPRIIFLEVPKDYYPHFKKALENRPLGKDMTVEHADTDILRAIMRS